MATENGSGGGPVAAGGQSPQLGNLVKALAAARAKFERIEKEQTAGKEGGKRWRYASLDAAIGATAPALAEHGLIVMQLPDSHESGGVAVETILLHESGEWISRRLRLPCGPEPQSVGSAITYARRYAYLALLNLAPADDDDGQRAQQSAQRWQDRRDHAVGRAHRAQPQRAEPAPPIEPSAEDENQEPPPWPAVWDAIRAELKRSESEPIGHDYATRLLLPEIVKRSGWSIVGVERAVGTELSCMLEDLPRVDARKRPFGQTWVARALKRFPEAEILAEYDRAKDASEGADEPVATPGPAATAESEPAQGADGLAIPHIADILDRLSGAHEDFPGEDEAAAWAVLRDVRDRLAEHYPEAIRQGLTGTEGGAAKMAIYRKGDNGGRTSAEAEAAVVAALELETLADLPLVLAPAVSAVLAAFPAAPTATSEPAAPPATNGHAGDRGKMPAGWRAMDAKMLGQLVRAMVAQGSIPEEDLPAAGEKLSKAAAIALVEAAVRRHGIAEEGGAS
jgi:hypothetical protein